MIPTSTTESLLGRPKTALKMRVRSATHRDQVIQLESAKITIGSSRRCTLRLKSPQVAPVQCLILRGENEMVVRSCSASTRLNNSVFDETTLRCGDRLSIGPIELVVLDDHAAVATAGGQAVVENTGAERGGQTDLETRLRSLEQQKQDWLAAKAQEGQLLSRQREELTNEQRQFEQQQADLNSRRQHFDEQQQQLNQDRGTVDLERQQLAEQKRQFEQSKSQREPSQEDAASARRQQTLENREKMLREGEESLERQKAELDQQRQQLQQQAADIDGQVANLSQRKREIEEAAAAQNQSQNSARTVMETALAEREQKIQAATAELDANLNSHQAEQAKWAAECATWQTQKDAWEAEKADWDAKHAERNDELKAQQARLEQTKLALIEQDAALQFKQQKVESQESQLSQALQAVEQQRGELKQLRQSVEEEKQTRDGHSKEIEQQRESLQQQQQALAEQKEAAQNAREEKETQLLQKLNERGEQVAQLANQVEQLRCELKTQSELHEQKLNESAAANTQRSTALETQVTELEAKCQQLTQNCDQLTEEKKTLEQRLAESSTQQTSPRQDESQEAADDSRSQPNSNTGAGEADETELFARLRAMSLLKDSAQEQAADELGEPGAESSIFKRFAAERRAAEPKARQHEEETVQDESEAVEHEQETAELAEEVAEPETVAEPEVEIQPAEVASAPVVQTKPVESDRHSEDSSIDDYMTKLLQRMRGMSGEDPAPVAPQSNKNRVETAESAAKARAAAATENGLAEEEKPAVPLKFEPRSAAPEKSRDLAAMREIANMTSRAAIATHSHQHGTNQAWSTVWVGVFSLVAGIVLLCLTPALFSLLTLLALAAWGVAGYLFYQSRSVLRNLQLSKRHKQTQLEEIAREQHLAKPEHAEKQTSADELQPQASEVQPSVGEAQKPAQTE